MILMITECIAAAFIAYIIGSIPTGYIVVKSFTGQDIRTIGSGSTGATNVKRVMGKKWFFIVLLLDALKGAVPVLLAKYLPFLSTHSAEIAGLTAVIAAIFVLIGHSKSVFLGFTGGKSVASGVGTMLALSPIVGITVAVIWAVITYTSKYVSLGSVIALALSPFLMFLFGQPHSYICYSAVGAVYVIYLHRENIKRLLAGTENKVR